MIDVKQRPNVSAQLYAGITIDSKTSIYFLNFSYPTDS